MLRFAYGAGAALLLVLAGFFFYQSFATDGEAQPSVAVPGAPPATEGDDEVPDDEPAGSRPPPAADARNKEQRRFDRADKDKNGAVTLPELYEPRRRAFARLDTNGDGRLGFEEWAVRTQTKFGEADRDRNGALTRQEYAATAPRRRAAARTKAACNC